MLLRDVSRTYKSKEWKALKKAVFARQGGKDYITGMNLLPQWECHHLDDCHLNDLNPDKFIGLNKKTHFILHYLFLWSKDDSFAENLRLAYNKMKEYHEAFYGAEPHSSSSSVA